MKICSMTKTTLVTKTEKRRGMVVSRRSARALLGTLLAEGRGGGGDRALGARDGRACWVAHAGLAADPSSLAVLGTWEPFFFHAGSLEMPRGCPSIALAGVV